jgi:GT2 family glycosyltransferase
MLDSLSAAKTPACVDIRLYLHVDGQISLAKQEMIGKFKPYKVVYSSENVGLAKGLNKIIKVVENECYFFRMDTDDLIHPDRFIKQIDFMDRNPSIELSGAGIQEFEGNKDNIVSSRVYPSQRNEILRYMIKGSPFAHVTVCFRAGFFDKYGLYPENYPLNEDIAFWFKAHKNGVVSSNIDDSVVLVRMDSAYGRRTFQKAWSELKVYLAIARWQKRLPAYPISRFLFRLLPKTLVKVMYESKLRKSVLE